VFLPSLLHQIVYSSLLRRFFLGNITSDAVGEGIKSMYSDMPFGRIEIQRYMNFIGRRTRTRQNRNPAPSTLISRSPIQQWPFYNLFPFDVDELTSPKYILDQLSQLRSKSHPGSADSHRHWCCHRFRSRDGYYLLVVDETPCHGR